MATLQELLLRAQLLREETAVNSISPERAGGIMYDTLAYINQMQLQAANPLLISKIYASVASMEADSAPVSDLTGEPLRPGQVVCIASGDPDDPDDGVIYRFDGIDSDSTSSWTAVGRLGSDPYLEGYLYRGIAVLTPTATDPGVPTQKVFYIASQPGTYTNFSGIVVNDGEVAILKYNGSWSKETILDTTDNLYTGGGKPLSAEQGKTLWNAISKINTESFSRNLIDLSLANLTYSIRRVTDNVYLESGQVYVIEGVFASVPATGSQVNIYLYADGETNQNNYKKRILLYAASWDTIRKATFVPTDSGMYFIAARYVSTEPGVDVELKIKNSDANLSTEIDSVRELITEKYAFETEFVAASTVVRSESFTLYEGAQYELAAELLDEPTDNAQINVGIVKNGTSSPVISRIILYGGSDWKGISRVSFIPPETGGYQIISRVIVGGDGGQPRVSCTINNPFYTQGGDVENDMDLPAYYYPYIDNRLQDAKKVMGSCGAGGFAMFLVSDTHHPQNYGWSTAMMRYVGEKLQVRRLLYGGDICPSVTTLWGDATAQDAIALSDNAVTNLLSGVRGKIYRVKGNHDYSVANYSYWKAGKSYKAGSIVVWSEYYGGGDNHEWTCLVDNSDSVFDTDKWERGDIGGYQLSQVEAQRLILADSEANGDCTFPDNSNACYYYFDIPRSKVRVICWDTCDSDTGFHGISNVTQYITNAQFKWVIENAILTVPSGYKIVTFGHVPTFDNNALEGSGYTSPAWDATRRALYHAIATRGSITIGGTTYDFSTFASDIILDICGHVHGDTMTCVDGIFGVGIAADFWADVTKHSPVYQLFNITSVATRTAGSIREQAFDLVVFDFSNDYVTFLRFGAGTDRKINLVPKSVAAGATLQITHSLTGAVSYAVYDAALGYQNTTLNAWQPTSTLASIDSAGVLTAISAGEVVVLVYDEDNNIVEVIGVTIS